MNCQNPFYSGRLDSLDLIKILSCFFVIYIHSNLVQYDLFGSEYFLAFSRVAVPLFFMTTGFFYPILLKQEKISIYRKKIIKLTCWVTFFYFILFPGYFFQFELKNYIGWLLFNCAPIPHLWYLYALIYILSVLKIFNRFGSIKIEYLIALLLLFNYFLSYSTQLHLYRNFLFTGLPYVLLGIIINEQKTNIILKLPNIKLGIIIFFSFIILLFIELNIYKTYNKNPLRDHFFMTLPLCLVIFFYALKYSKIESKRLLKIINSCNPTFIYVSHYGIIKYLELALSIFIPYNNFHNYMYPFFIMFICLIIYKILYSWPVKI